MGTDGSIPGAARLHLVDGITLLRPEEQVFTAMLAGFANQQLARNLARSTVEGRENTVKAFAAYVNTYPWQWTPAMVDEMARRPALATGAETLDDPLLL
ncbi:hypothetical protein AB0M50_20000 [Nonomuraea fuscirosea]|uniref:hypothetical protein n=1 Tax=Nonomuraea fuscirosea TaxID=1291556 RepID=UPI003438C0B5